MRRYIIIIAIGPSELERQVNDFLEDNQEHAGWALFGVPRWDNGYWIQTLYDSECVGAEA